MVWTTTKERILKLSQRLVEIQRPIRILDAIKWDSEIEEGLKKSKFKDLPKLGPDYYEEKLPLGFDAKVKIQELEELIQEIYLLLGPEDAVGKLLTKTAEQYRDVVQMLLVRGTAAFGEYSRKLYGSPKDTLHGDQNRVSDLGHLLYSILDRLDEQALSSQDYPEDLTAEEVVDLLNERFQKYFKDDNVCARISDGILADAAAGSDTVKIREGSLFSVRDVDILEVHEGWVHVGTTQNGLSQRVAKWLSKGPPRVAATQEGLAVIMEIFTFRTYPRRARQINDRIIAIDKAEDGASLLDIIEFYRTEGYSEEDCLSNAKRIFRGGTLEGGAPFTKDIAYCKGFIENYNFLRAAIRAGKPQLIPYLFAGKLHVDDVPLLYQRSLEGIVDAPNYLPPQFRDLNGIAVWMSFSSFLNQVDLKRIQEHYDKLFSEHI